MIFSFCLILFISVFGLNPVKSLNLTHRGLEKVPQNISNEVKIILSHNKINSIDDQVFGPNTQEIYLDHNNMSYINPIIFRDLYNLSALDLSNNLLQSFEIDFNFVKSQTKYTIVNLNFNYHLTLQSISLKLHYNENRMKITVVNI